MTLKDIAKELAAARQRQHLTKYRIMKISGLRYETIDAIETGRSGYNTTALLAYASAVNMKVRIESNFAEVR